MAQPQGKYNLRLADGYYRHSPVVDPMGPMTGLYRVLRGGTWSLSAWSGQAAYRDGGQPNGRNNGLGFRVATIPSGK